MNLSDLTGEQTRQAIDVDQIFAAYREARDELDRRYAGSMSWKTVRGREYLYRKRRDAWKSLGPRTVETEEAFARFHANRERLRDRVEGLAARIDAMAPVNRALRLGRLPVIAARILRSLARAHLSDTAITVVGTNALFVYERLAGVQIEGSYLATADVDLLFDARSSLKLLAPDVAASGVMGLLRKLDHSFDVMGRGGFRAVNRDGYIVDLIMAAGKDRMKAPARSRIGSDNDDLQAVEIEGLSWLVNSPKVTGTPRSRPCQGQARPGAGGAGRGASAQPLAASSVRRCGARRFAAGSSRACLIPVSGFDRDAGYQARTGLVAARGKREGSVTSRPAAATRSGPRRRRASAPVVRPCR